MSRVFAVVSLAVALLAAPGAAHASDRVDLIVRRDPGLSAAERASLRADAGVQHERSLRLSDTEVVSVPADRAGAALRELRADPDVRIAVRDRQASPAAGTGQDALWSNLWALNNTGQNLYLNQSSYYFGGTADADMDIPEAWALAPDPGSGVLVGVVDSGAPADHPDLAGQIVPGGWDYVHNGPDTSDNYGHGTHVTGTIVALNGNGAGISGVAPAAKVEELRVFADDDHNGDTAGTGWFSWILDAFDKAGNDGARVVNASLGGVGNSDTAELLARVVSKHPGTLYVVAAGNEHTDLDTGDVYLPCETPAPNVLCVAASDSSDRRAGFSNYGATNVDVFAPGTLIESTTMDGAYGYKDGTSMATPNAAGVAALLFAQNPALTGAAVRQRLIDTVDLKLGLPSVAGGRINALRALEVKRPDGDSDGIADDADGDGVPRVDDLCPSDPGPASDRGCPTPADRDQDGVPDSADACPDASGTAFANGCPPPPAADRDGDGSFDGYDRCPSEPGLAMYDGCPAPGEPRVTSIRAGGRAGRVTVHVALSRPAAVTISAQRQICRAGRCAWKTARRATIPAAGTVTLRLPAGRYRLRVTAAGGPVRTKLLTVRR